MKVEQMKKGVCLSTRLTALVGVLLLAICGIVGATLWVTQAQKADGLVINLAGRQRMLTQKMTKATLGYVIERREQDEARRQVDLLVETRGHLARTIAAARKAGAFTLTEDTLDFAPAPAARQIAERFSSDKQLTLRQVSNKYRNSGNRPDEYEAAVLAKMEKDPEGWRERDWMEKVVEGDQATMRYLRPLFVEQACLTCHGAPDDVPAFITEKYPDDRATGYRVGELRGAVSVSWPTRTADITGHRVEALEARDLFEGTLGALRDGGPAACGDKNAVLPPCENERIRAQLRVVQAVWGEFKGSIDLILRDEALGEDELTPALNVVLTRNQELLAEMNKAVGMFQADSDARVATLTTIQYAAGIAALLAFVTVFFYLRLKVTRPLGDAVRAANAVAEGDLTQTCPITTTDEVGQLSHALNEMVANLRNVVAQINSAGSEMVSASREQAEGAKNQTVATEEMANTVTKLLASAKKTAESAGSVAEQAELAANECTSGTTSVEGAVQGIKGVHERVEKIAAHMVDLGSKSQQISGALDIITELSEQTNLLSLNASIEAAGAGEAGKRFAVVASEIRKLAERATDSTGEIHSLIDSIQETVNTTIMATEEGTKAVRDGVRLTEEVDKSLGRIAEQVASTTQSAKAIEMGSRQQATAIEQMESAIKNVDTGARQTADTACQLDSNAQVLLETARQLQRNERELQAVRVEHDNAH